MKKIVNYLRDNLLFKKILFALSLAFLALYVFSIPSFSGRGNFRFVSYFLMALLTFFSALYVFLYKTFQFKKRYIFPLVFVVHALVGTIFYSKDYRGWLTLLLLFMSFIVFILTFSVIKNSDLIILVIVSSLLAFAFYFLIHYRNEIIHYSSLDKESYRLGKYFDNVNQIGSHVSVGLLLSFYSIFFLKNKYRLLYIIPIVIFLVVGFLTGSRTFIVSTIISILSFAFIKFKRHKWIFIIIVGCVILLFIILINLPFMSFVKNQIDKLIY